MIIVNIHASNNRSSKYVKQKLTEMKGKIDSSTIIIGDFYTPFSKMDRTTR